MVLPSITEKSIVLYGDHEVEIDPIDDERQMPQDMQTSFYSISREYEKLMDDRYIDGASVPTNTENKNPFGRNPGSG